MESEDDCLLVDEYFHVLPHLAYSPVCLPGRGANMNELESQLLGCKCSPNEICLSFSSCKKVHLCEENYSPNKLLLEKKWENASIVECNSQCTCSAITCSNRLIQFGPRKNLEVFVSSAEKGYGLKTKELIPKGAFICEYAGEIIGPEEAKKRFSKSSSCGNMNYIFILREMIKSSSFIIETIIDPSVIGNIGRYINHSCEPNSVIIPVRVNSPVPRLGIFAIKCILPGDEICYDYSGGSISSQGSSKMTSDQKMCFCGASSCSRFLPFDLSLL